MAVILVPALAQAALGAEDTSTAVAEAVKAAKNQAATLQVPENKHRLEGCAAAEQAFNQYKAPAFQEKLQQEQIAITTRQGIAAKTSVAPDDDINGSLVLFLSSALPLETLQAFLKELSQVGGDNAIPNISAVMPGLPEGLEDMAGNLHYFSQILQIDPACRSTPENDCPWLALPLHIDPTLFQRYGVGATPALVFDNGQDQWLIHGDAGLAVLLDEIAKAAKSKALHLITKRLRGSH